MLSPDYILHISEGAEEIAEMLHQEITKRIIERMMLRMGRGDDYLLTPTDKWQLEVLRDSGVLLEEIQREIAEKTKLQEKEVKDAFEEAGVRALDYDNKVYQTAGLSPAPLRQSPSLVRLMQRNYEATMGEWRNFTRTTASAAQQEFIKACDKAYHLTTSGTISYSQAVKEAVNEVASKGVEVVYKNPETGKERRDTIETATLRAVRTGVSQATGAIQMKRLQEMGWDIVLTSAHLGARTGDGGQNPGNHLWWQGQFFSLDGKTPGLPLFVESTGYGTVEGICGVNCRHSFGAGDGENNPFADILKEDNYKVEKLQQRQRLLERRIRKTKREVMAWKAAVDSATDERVKFENDLMYQKKSALLQKQNKEYEQFCKSNNLKKLNDRIQIAKWDRQQAAAARGAAKRYENANANMYRVKSSIDKDSYANYNSVRSADELRSVAQNIKADISNYATRESKWSGRINIDNSLITKNALGEKEWSCDITLVDTVDDGVVWHEMLHSCSGSYYDNSVYSANQAIEEASVEFLKQQICKERQINSSYVYKNYTEVLEVINGKFGYGSNMEFAKELFNIPLPNRYQWLEDKVDDSLRSLGASFSDYNDVMLYLQQLKGAIL